MASRDLLRRGRGEPPASVTLRPDGDGTLL